MLVFRDSPIAGCDLATVDVRTGPFLPTCPPITLRLLALEVPIDAPLAPTLSLVREDKAIAGELRGASAFAACC